ncbi:hypothetical protein FACS1894147_08000 [Spirochaetia bacterium]|nr:hypothetical protein FACS1894147_08000 [Spirochaetia bacterium]
MNSFALFRLMVPPAGAEGGGASLITTFVPFILIIGIFYFLIIRPQNKKQKETQKMLSALKKGDKIVTIGGIHGAIQSVKEHTVVVRVDENARMEFSRSAISSVEAVASASVRQEEKLEEKKDGASGNGTSE